jgi:hypothetical protein
VATVTRLTRERWVMLRSRRANRIVNQPTLRRDDPKDEYIEQLLRQIAQLQRENESLRAAGRGTSGGGGGGGSMSGAGGGTDLRLPPIDASSEESSRLLVGQGGLVLDGSPQRGGGWGNGQGPGARSLSVSGSAAVAPRRGKRGESNRAMAS